MKAEVESGRAIWTQGEVSVTVDIITARDGWLVIRQPGGDLCGIIWSDGSYYADLLVDENDFPVRSLDQACRVRGTVNMGGLGAIL